MMFSKSHSMPSQYIPKYRSLGDIRLSSVCYILCIIWSFRLSSIAYAIDGFSLFWYLLGSLALFFAVPTYAKGEVKFTTIHAAVLAFCVLLASISIVKGSPITVWLDDVFEILLLAVMMDIGLNSGGKSFVKWGFRISAVLVSANTISAFIFPHAMFRDASGAASVFLMGTDNSMIVRYMLAILFELLYRRNESGGSFSIPFIGLTNLIIFAFVRDIATGKVMAIALTLMLFAMRAVPSFRLSARIGVLLNIAFFVIVVLGQSALGWADPIFQMLGRESDFTHRAQLWEFTAGLIANNPILGIGCVSDESFNYLIRTTTNLGLYNTGNPHNTYLTVLLSGGIVTFALFSAIIAIACNKSRGNESVTIVAVLSLFLFVYMFHAQVEGRDTAYVIAMAVCLFTLRRKTGAERWAGRYA